MKAFEEVKPSQYLVVGLCRKYKEVTKFCSDENDVRVFSGSWLDGEWRVGQSPTSPSDAAFLASGRTVEIYGRGRFGYERLDFHDEVTMVGREM